MRYRLAGAYDSNIALLLATGADREESWARLCEVLRRTRIRGLDLATNREFHFGLLKWFLHRDPWAKPTTAFVVPYLTQVGLLAREATAIDLEYAFHEIERRQIAALGPDARQFFDLKETLVERPLRMLFREPHFVSAWLSQHMHDYTVEGGRVTFRRNPVDVLDDTYRLLDLESDGTAAAAECIWSHDRALLDSARTFYARLAAHVPAGTGWAELDRRLRGRTPAFGLSAPLWERVSAAHAGHQLGLEILGIVPLLGAAVNFFDLRLGDDLTPVIPAALRDPERQEAAKKMLAPPPATRADEIVAAMGGVYWDREAPHLPPFVEEGTHFDKGQPLYIIEVMKMFNKVYAPFSGRVVSILVRETGAIVRKGQPLFRVDPDEKVVEEDPGERARRIRETTDRYLANLL
jgi:biotin carboxyl carrier protein